MPARRRNARGEGARLRADLLAGAQRILERTGNEDDVSLRAVAREVGVSAPSIYAHFPDSGAMVDALVAEAFQEFTTLLAQAHAQAPPEQRLLAICRAYITFGTDHPERYLTLFGRRRTTQPRHPFADSKGADAFTILSDTIAESFGVTPELAVHDATLLWAGLHGYVTLRAGSPGFPWFGSDDDICRALVERAALVAQHRQM
ncbi:MAG: TetR family transcriptional regulator [Mycobacterium sp.]|nr:TetR family transcriptional regulator [Mycobacterium sp.]